MASYNTPGSIFRGKKFLRDLKLAFKIFATDFFLKIDEKKIPAVSQPIYGKFGVMKKKGSMGRYIWKEGIFEIFKFFHPKLSTSAEKICERSNK